MTARLVGGGLGAVLGLAAGTAWWFVWGCQVCAPGGDMYGPVAMSVLVGTLAGTWLGEAPPS